MEHSKIRRSADFSKIPQPASLQEVLDGFEESVATVRRELPRFGEAGLQETWRLVQGDRELMAIPREQFVQYHANHWYQHRGQFSVYLRLLNVAVPASFGPSADEAPVF